jgi:hypothetical protein
MDSSSLQKKRPVDTLTYDNWEEWFYLFQEWTKGEGIDFVLRKTAQQYALQTTQGPAGLGGHLLDIQDLLESLNIVEEPLLQGQWDQTRLERWSKAESKIRYTMTICVSDIDAKALKEYGTVKAGWEALRVKYSNIRPATAREDQIKLTNYQWDNSQTIDSAWIEIMALRRRVVSANPNLTKAYDEAMLLQFLLPALPEGYAVTVTTLDVQPNLSVYDKLTALRNREDALRSIKDAEDKALKQKRVLFLKTALSASSASAALMISMNVNSGKHLTRSLTP